MDTSDDSFYRECAIAAMSSLIRKVPLADREKGDDVDTISLEICKSADRYAASMVNIRRGRLNGVHPSLGQLTPAFQSAVCRAQVPCCNSCDTFPSLQAYKDAVTWHLYARCQCERVEFELPWPFAEKETATESEIKMLGFHIY